MLIKNSDKNNLSNSEATFLPSTRTERLLKLGRVGIHWIARAEYFKMSTHVPGFQSLFSFFLDDQTHVSSSKVFSFIFCIGKSSHQHKV